MMWETTYLASIKDHLKPHLPSPASTEEAANTKTCEDWMDLSFGDVVDRKQTVHSEILRFKHFRASWEYSALRKASGLAWHIAKVPSSTLAMRRSLCRKLRALSPPIPGDGLGREDVLWIFLQLDLRIKEHKEHVDSQFKELMARWKLEVRSWTKDSSEMVRYVKNDLPPKMITLRIQGQQTNSPVALGGELKAYWDKIESWPRNMSAQTVWEVVLDKYSFFVPKVPCMVRLTPELLSEQAKQMRISACGPDAWSVQEAKRLPYAAWSALIELITGPNFSWASANFLLFSRRTPVVKPGVTDPEAGDIRPIDVHSVILRIILGGFAACLRGWLRAILHHSQFSAFQGILPPVACLALWTEGARIGARKLIFISLDLSKMFNMISAEVVTKLAVLAGLDLSSARPLADPILHAHTTWRLPHNSTAPFVKLERGLPQGLPTSVAGAELIVSLLLRRLEGCCMCEPFSYMDDIQCISCSAIWG